MPQVFKFLSQLNSSAPFSRPRRSRYHAVRLSLATGSILHEMPIKMICTSTRSDTNGAIRARKAKLANCARCSQSCLGDALIEASSD